jgi:formylglycine-generating enzyme required for sulfatase activity
MRLKKSLWLVTLAICCLTFFAQAINSQDRGAGVRVRYNQDGVTREIKLYDASYALVIGMSVYQYWPQLNGPKTDVEEVKKVLEEHNFKVETAFDLTGEQLKQRIEKFIGDYGLQVNNRLLVYFAGHGATTKTADGREFGYIVPIDAPQNTNDDDFKRKAISMERLEGYAKQIETKHAMFVFDSCFSGKLVTRSELLPPAISEYLTRNIRQFITSGAANQKVPDISEFRKWFVRGLRGEADLTKDGYVTGTELAKFLNEKVTNNSGGAQTPQYGTTRDADLEGGDMVFPYNMSEEQKRLAADEEANWQTIKDSKNPQVFRDFLNLYPTGKYASEAKSLLLKLNAGTTTGEGPRVAPLNFATFDFNTFQITGSGVTETQIKKSARFYEEDLGSNVKLKMVEISPGKFKMGSNDTVEEKPIREVTINQFYMGIYEVTQAQWRAVAKMPKVKINLPTDPSYFAGDDLPVENINWEQAEEFCLRLSRYTGRAYTLPSEAEWEYAARGGTIGSFAFGERLKPDIVNYNSTTVTTKGAAGVYRKQTIPVGSLGFANNFGLYEMHGNVSEWCFDTWHDDYNGAPKDGSAWVGQQEKRVIRGGSFMLLASRLCSSCRDSLEKDLSNNRVGFRVVMRPVLP